MGVQLEVLLVVTHGLVFHCEVSNKHHHLQEFAESSLSQRSRQHYRIRQWQVYMNMWWSAVSLGRQVGTLSWLLFLITGVQPSFSSQMNLTL